MESAVHLPANSDSCLVGGGEMGARIRAFDWEETPLGPPARWPQSLRMAVRIMLAARQPMSVWWGEALINLYNDPYRAIAGGKHPAALGRPAKAVWREIWDRVAPRVDSCMRRNEGASDEALLLITERHGHREETYCTVSYSPIPKEGGGVGGIVCAHTDDTHRIIGERRMALLRDLAARTAAARKVEEACRLCAASLATDPQDLPFAALYLLDDRGGSNDRLSRIAAAGIGPGHPAAPDAMSAAAGSPWPVKDALDTGAIQIVPAAPLPGGPLPRGAWSEPPHDIALVPLPRSGPAGRAGLLLAGCNPYRPMDRNERAFLELVAGQAAAAIANARAYEEARRRAESLAELDTRLGLALKSTGLGVWESQLGAKRIRADANLAAMFGLPAAPTVLDDETWMGRIHPEDRARFENDLAQRRLDRQPLDCEFRVLHPDGTVRWLAVQGAVVRQSDEQRGRSVGVARDVTERRLAEERQRLLLHELNHRVRNSLATVLALAQQTAATAETVPGFLDAYRARVMALAQAHNLLTQGNWEGASLRALVEAILAPDAHANPGAVEVRGPEVDLAAPQALAIVLGLHELATNARKYGALSAPRGRVAVEWRCTQDDGGVLVSLQWAEAGGPPVSVPTRRGFGSRMLTRSLATDLDGTVTLDFEPSGVQCRIAFRSERRHG